MDKAANLAQNCMDDSDCATRLVSMKIFTKRAWRIIRRSPRRAVRDWLKAFINEGNFVSFLTAAFSSYLAIRTANLPALFEEADAWVTAITAFAYTVIGWFLICAIRAPLIVYLEEKRSGTWFGGRYVLDKPCEVFQVRAKATGKPEFYRFRIEVAEPNSFIYFKIVCDGDPPQKLFTAQVFGEVFLLPIVTGYGCIQGGARLGRKREAQLVVIMKETAVSQTFRVFCSEFAFGDPDEHHGKTGDSNPPWLAKRMAELEARITKD